MVYEDAEKYYANVAKKGRQLIHEALDALFDLPPTSASQGKGTVLAFNPTMFPRLDIIKVPLATTSFAQDAIVQAAEDGTHEYLLMQSEHGSGCSIPRGLLSECRSASGVS